MNKPNNEEKRAFYNVLVPRFNWFTPDEQDALMDKADTNAKLFNSDALSILTNLAFMESFSKGKPAWLNA